MDKRENSGINEKKATELAIKFLIQCYFGDTSDPLLASIDRAYLDMQTHTVKAEKWADNNALFERRKIITEVLYTAINCLSNVTSFDEWHLKLTDTIIEKDSVAGVKALKVGQIQKWINMTLKYCFTLKQLGVEGIDDFFNEENAKMFHAPLDSFVLAAKGISKPAWSKIETYGCYEGIQKEVSFFEEYDQWPEWARKARLKKDGTEKKAESGSYRRYLQEEGGGYSFQK